MRPLAAISDKTRVYVLMTGLVTGCTSQCECGDMPPVWLPPPPGFELPVEECPVTDPCDSIGEQEFYHPVGTPAGCCLPRTQSGTDEHPVAVFPVIISDPDDPANGCPDWIGGCYAGPEDTEWECEEFPPLGSSAASSNAARRGSYITYGPKNNQVGACDPKDSADCKPM